MTSKFSIFRLLLLTTLVLAGCSTKPAVGPVKESVFSDYLFAVYASANGDLEVASKSYQKVLAEDPGNLHLMEEAFSYYLYAGDYDAAFQVGKEFYKANPENTPAAMLMAVEAFRQGRSGAMDEYLAHVKGFGFDNLMTPLMKGWMKARKGDTDGALAALEPLGEFKPFEEYYFENRALILDYGGRINEANAAYARQVTSTEISSLQPVLNYGAFLQTNNRDKEARSLYARFLEMLPGNMQLTDAVARMDRGDPPASYADDTTEAMAMAFLRTGVAIGRERARVPAIIYSRLALYLDPDLDEAHIYLGGLLAGEVTPEMALDAYKKVDPFGPYGDEIILRRALLLSSYDQWDEAYAVLNQHLEAYPGDVEALATLGDLYRNQEDFENALKYYQLAITIKGELLTEDWFLLFTRGIAFERLGRWQEAEVDFKKALEFRPGDPDVLNYLGYTWIDQGVHLEEGREMIERAVAQRPGSGYIVDSLGWAQYLMGDYEGAVQSLETAVLLEPGDPTLNDHLGDAYWKIGREREARFQWEHAIVLGAKPDEAIKIATKIEFGLTLAALLEEKK